MDLDLHKTAATVIAIARTDTGLTAPAFDRDIAVNGIGGPYGPLGNACYEVANRHMPEVVPGQDNRLDERAVNQARLWETLLPELEAYATRCRTRKYSGWSNESKARGRRIQYAD
ncbi:hypothetical protein [Micromonospora haikouensis]|uniref:hypothetical protein n=1 Tax=Micromonospora haikouensis TaxID=686309 RepID=UPI003D764783